MASLIIRPEKIGDLVVATPVFRALKKTFPDEEVHLLVDEGCAPLVRDDPHLDRILALPWRGPRRGQRPPLRSLFRLLARNGPYRRAVILYPDWEPWNWILGLLRVPQVAQLGGTIGAVLWRHAMVLRQHHAGGEPMSELYLRVAERVGAQPGSDPGARQPRLYLADAERSAILERFPALAARGNIFIHAFSLTVGANLSPGAYFALARYLAEQPGHRVWIIGTAGEAQKFPPPVHPQISTELIGHVTLRQLLAACAHADLLIGGSSGVVHLAAAIGTPTLGLYCPANRHPEVWGPQGRWAKTLVAPPSQCKAMGAQASGCSQPEGFCDLAFAFPPELIWQEGRKLMSAAGRS